MSLKFEQSEAFRLYFVLLRLYREKEISEKTLMKAVNAELERGEFDYEKLVSLSNSFNSYLNKCIFRTLEQAVVAQPEPKGPDKQYSCSELGKILGVDRVTVNQWVSAGKFENVQKRGKKNMLLESEIDKFIKKSPNKYQQVWANHKK
jgi:hypothetical protein